jgi:hypothetical protein
VGEMKIITNSLIAQLLELDLNCYSEIVGRELKKVSDGIIQANAQHNEEMMNELLDELKRMITITLLICLCFYNSEKHVSIPTNNVLLQSNHKIFNSHTD